jgi:hypothetical protein
MNAALKAKWVAALRSGGYRQTTGTMRRASSSGVEYCCLGVLCALAGDAIANEAERFRSYSFCGNAMSWEVSRHLQSMNDFQRASFAEIADWIEANVPADTVTA